MIKSIWVFLMEQTPLWIAVLSKYTRALLYKVEMMSTWELISKSLFFHFRRVEDRNGIFYSSSDSLGMFLRKGDWLRFLDHNVTFMQNGITIGARARDDTEREAISIWLSVILGWQCCFFWGWPMMIMVWDRECEILLSTNNFDYIREVQSWVVACCLLLVYAVTYIR